MPVVYRCDVCGDEYDNASKAPTYTPFWAHARILCQKCTDIGERIVEERDENLLQEIERRRFNR